MAQMGKIYEYGIRVYGIFYKISRFIKENQVTKLDKDSYDNKNQTLYKIEFRYLNETSRDMLVNLFELGINGDLSIEYYDAEFDCNFRVLDFNYIKSYTFKYCSDINSYSVELQLIKERGN